MNTLFVRTLVNFTELFNQIAFSEPNGLGCDLDLKSFTKNVMDISMVSASRAAEKKAFT